MLVEIVLTALGLRVLGLVFAKIGLAVDGMTLAALTCYNKIDNRRSRL